MNRITEKLLAAVSNWTGVPRNAAYNIREDGQCAGRQSTAHIRITSCLLYTSIWRFPIMVQKYGGMTFLIPYFIFVILIASSGVMEEFALGRRAAAGPVGAFGMCTEERTGKRRSGELIGAIPIIGALMLAIGYTVVLGWIFKYTWLAISGGLFAMGQDMSIIGPAFDATSATLTNANGEAFSFVQSVGCLLYTSRCV